MQCSSHLEGNGGQESIESALAIACDNDDSVTAVIGIPHFALSRVSTKVIARLMAKCGLTLQTSFTDHRLFAKRQVCLSEAAGKSCLYCIVDRC